VIEIFGGTVARPMGAGAGTAWTIRAASRPLNSLPSMLAYPQIDPVAIALGPLKIHWYGLMYLVAFGLFMLLARMRASLPHLAREGWAKQDVEDLMFYGIVGVILGGRLGWILFYQPAHYLANPLEVFAIWKGGMSFHGGLLGVIAALALFGHRRGRPFLQVADLVAPCVPTGLAAGRIGNFINGELWGRAADASLPWAMVFPGDRLQIARHPSQIYQMLLEGLLLFVLLWLYARRERGRGQVAGAFLIGYGLLRFVAEYFREPDSFLGLLALGFSMGQWLSLPMIALGVFLWSRGRNLRSPA
jgi:phosphatidylglycerol:prolipoprotein diacylglycerol transferase